MVRERTIFTAALIAAAAAAFYLASGAAPTVADPLPVPAATPPTPVAPVPIAAAAKAALPTSSAKTAAPALHYPDGSSMPLLNGVRDPLTIAWPADRPFAPVVDTVVDDKGQSWYRHGDGSWTTSQIDANDPTRGIGLVFTPAPARPLRLRGQ